MYFSCIFLTYRKATAAGNRTQDLLEYVTSMQRENIPELMAQGEVAYFEIVPYQRFTGTTIGTTIVLVQ